MGYMKFRILFTAIATLLFCLAVMYPPEFLSSKNTSPEISMCTVTLYDANGGIIQEWTTKGNIRQYVSTNLLYFNDHESGRNFAITGTIIVRELQ